MRKIIELVGEFVLEFVRSLEFIIDDINKFAWYPKLFLNIFINFLIGIWKTGPTVIEFRTIRP